MKNSALKTLLLASLFALTSQAHASLWDDTKATASSAWQKTKETSQDIKEGAVQKWHEATADKPKESGDDSGSLSDIKKLGDKETYVKAWEGIKESAKNPNKPDVDENGIPKSE